MTARRRAVGEEVTQFHGKWPFARVLGVQEPFSVLFSFGNMAAHYRGLVKVRRRIPASYPLRRYYEAFAILGVASWVFSVIFHTRDFRLTERLDYFAAGASVLYGLYMAAVRIFRLDRPAPGPGPLPSATSSSSSSSRGRGGGPGPLLRLWTVLCCALYAGHVGYLTLWRWSYTYNMAANVAVGVLQNALWAVFSYFHWRARRRAWALLPVACVVWLMSAMSLELLDFPPFWDAIDAHSLWHFGTIGPIVLWYK